MPDERKDSIEQGIAVPPESDVGRAAAEERARRAAEGPEIGGAMGGTSDADSPAEESAYERQRREATEADKGGSAFEEDEHDSGRRADRHRGPGEGAD